MTKPTPEQVEEIARMLHEDFWRGISFTPDPGWYGMPEWRRDEWRAEARKFIASCEAQP